VVLPDVYLELATDAGVFSPGRLDPGTRLLLEESPAPPPSGDLLDLGCGYGPIACVLAVRSPGAAVWAVDVNERALELCARNAAAAGLANVRCVTPDDPSVPPGWPGSGPTRRSASARPPCTSCLACGCAALIRAAARTWWPAATSAPTRCTAGWPSRAGR